MSRRIRVCGECEHCKQPASIDRAWDLVKPFGCYHPEANIDGKLGAFVVPQRTNAERSIFTRIPKTCPRPDSEVIKSEDTRHHKDWVTIRFDDDAA